MRAFFYALAVTLLVFPIRARAQQVEPQVEKTYYDSGKVKGEIVHKPDGKIDRLREFYENGKLKEEATYLNDTDASVKNYDPSGALLSEGVSRGGVPDGEWKEYYAEGKVKAVATYKAGELLLKKEFRKNGTLASEQEGKNVRLFDKAGNFIEERKFETRNGAPALVVSKYEPGGVGRGAMIESAQTVYAEGEKIKKLIFRNNQLFRVKRYGDEGETVMDKTLAAMDAEEQEYKSGKKSGAYQRFTPQGEFEELTYQNGQLTQEKIFYDNGKVKSDTSFRGGKPVKRKQYDEKGNPKA